MGNTAKKLFDSTYSALQLPDENEKKAIAYVLLEHFGGIEKKDILVDKALSESVVIPKEIITRLNQEEPLQYILGETEFYGRRFLVNPSTLIPRPETEELVNLMIQQHKNKPNLEICDIGTGSGCIPITLAAELPQSKVTATDFSKTALETAKKNADLNHVQVQFILHDILKAPLPQPFDIIVSNPPYVTEAEKGQMEKNVLDHEPATALFVPNDNPLLFYKRITQEASEKLKPGGCLYFEINAQFGKETANELKKAGFSDIKIIKDLCGKDRFVSGSLQTTV
ncbi:peptide chain release factor N(5)-glutamine methyltransferase [Cytophagaceae bacterium ABcell3]|nr:peptide chain release factor N(5)-glutamine methyltransferase [Cytophagaceae bacterium ABcell3]